jgi:hypothetical protein
MGLMAAATVVYFSQSFSLSLMGVGVYLICLIPALFYGQRLQRDNKRLLTIMWTLADEMGYTTADLKRLSGKYGEVDWALTRPERLDFSPGAGVIKAVTCKMQIEQTQREIEALRLA